MIARRSLFSFLAVAPLAAVVKPPEPKRIEVEIKPGEVGQFIQIFNASDLWTFPAFPRRRHSGVAVSQEHCPYFERCYPCNDGYECVTREEIDAWEREHGPFDMEKSTAGIAYNHDLKPGEKGPIELRIAYTVNRRHRPPRFLPDWPARHI
jgi:hypothetical protein